MSVILLGHLGAMGRRYSAVLNKLGVEFQGADISDLGSMESLVGALPRARRIIVATPSQSHMNDLRYLDELAPYAQVLCEKPVVTTIADLQELGSMPVSGRLCVVNQYHYLPGVENDGPVLPSWYHYYNHGKDGLKWDCFQLYALAKGEVELSEASPIWECGINGIRMNLSHMDWAYIDMIEDWLGPQKRVWRWDVIERTTRRILAL